MGLGFDMITEIYQKDVNNYVFIQEDGKIERKGAYVKELNPLDYDLPIINKALVDFMTKNISLEKTINECNELIMFQKIVKVSNKYECGWHNNEKLTDKTFRVFASVNSTDTYIGKQKTEGATIEKFANTPEHCFIDNTNINNKPIPSKLNKEWYINLAKERLVQYGY
jgi:DNA polymerase